MPRVAIVTTTIYVPKALDAYMQNAQECGHKDVLFVVTGDTKTPPEAKTFCEEISAKWGYECVYQTVDDQKEWGKKYPELFEHIPWCCIQRRNLAILLAYERGCENIITIDDDNYFVPGQDFIEDHIGKLGQQQEIEVLQSTTGFINICDYLDEKRGYEFYARGYPIKQRWLPFPPTIKSSRQKKTVMVNAGLWLDDPDVDAITRLCNDICATRYNRTESFATEKGTWSPFNSQNTALAAALIPAYPLSPKVGRYDDIWASYVIYRIADHLNHVVAYGFPLVKQERNPHNYFNDHRAEEDGLEFTDRFCEWLRAMTLTGTTYFACFQEVTEQLKKCLAAEPNLKQRKIDFLNGFIETSDVWIATMKRMGKV